VPRTLTSVFSEPDDFLAALSGEGVVRFLVTSHGQFRARLTQIVLHRLRLSAGEEQLPRVALVAVPVDAVLVALPIGGGPLPICGGVRIGAGEIMTLGASQRLHMRTDGPCRWGSIWLPAAELVQYGSALTGVAFSVPSPARRWHPRPVMMRHLRHLHSAAIGLVESRLRVVIDAATAHGLEQQLIHGLVECLAKGSALEATGATREHQDIAIRLEALLQNHPGRAFRTAEICKTLGIPARLLRMACQDQLGMGPAEYIRLRRLRGGPPMKVLRRR
jgi:hypothetical protein